MRSNFHIRLRRDNTNIIRRSNNNNICNTSKYRIRNQKPRMPPPVLSNVVVVLVVPPRGPCYEKQKKQIQNERYIAEGDSTIFRIATHHLF